jgi:DNA-binding transcriptional LysR family regulator
MFLRTYCLPNSGSSLPCLGNAVTNLEKRLGVRLFNRTTRNVALTSAGREYVEAIAPSLSDIRNATQAVTDHGRKPTGTLRFSCSLAGGRQLLVPFVLEYRRRYNEMKVEIVTEGRLIDIIKEGFDAGVRLAEAVPLDMIAMPLVPHARHVVVGAPSYSQKCHDPPCRPSLRFMNASAPAIPAALSTAGSLNVAAKP